MKEKTSSRRKKATARSKNNSQQKEIACDIVEVDRMGFSISKWCFISYFTVGIIVKCIKIIISIFTHELWVFMGQVEKTHDNNEVDIIGQFQEIAVDQVDRISELPDDILISIISRLTLQEATATSILSSRWQHLYTYTTRLCFPPFEEQKSFRDEYLDEIQEKKFPNYVNMVNHVLDSYKGGSVLKEFSVRAPCLVGANTERWFEFALAREVEIINVHLVDFKNMTCGSYTFPLSTLISRNGGSSLRSLKSLKDLTLSGLVMDEKDLQFLLSSFAVLENLSIGCCEGLKNVSIVGHSLLKLKQLDISRSLDIRSIEVRDVMSLVSLSCYRVPYLEDLRLINLPKLIEFTTSEHRCDYMPGALPRMQSCMLDQLLHLKLVKCSPNSNSWTPVFPKLINLQHLELEVDMRYVAGSYGLVDLVPLIEACPLLEKLEMKFLWFLLDPKLKQERLSNSYFWTNTPNYHLKKVTLSGYFGSQSEAQFALMYIMKKAVALKELTVEACDITRKIRQGATARARQHFQPTTPNSVKLVII